MEKDLLIYKLAFNFIKGIGAVNTKNLISHCGGIKEVFYASKRQLLQVPGIASTKADIILNSAALYEAEKEYERVIKNKIGVHFYLDENYPEKLKHYEDAPVLLYSLGNIDFSDKKIVAIVGTRKVTDYGSILCERIIEGLKPYNILIVSGMAYGVDTVAHKKAVEQEIPTIGILGHGMDTLYPISNRKLAQNMMATGGLMSEFSLGTKPDRENFPKRNRIIAALADVVLIVESAESGGSMITAEYANNYFKDVFAIPGRADDEFSVGCNNLIKQHKAHLCTSAADIADTLRWSADSTTSQQMLLPLEGLDENETMVYDILKENPNSGLDTLHYQSKIPLTNLTSILLTLEFKGILKSLPGKKYILTR